MLNSNSTNGRSIVKYERIIYQTTELELKPKLEEIELIIKDLKNFKAPGEDKINPELLKLAGKDLATEIYLLVEDILWNKECMPKDWNLGIICPIFKKRDMKKVKNYRGISLLDITYKALLIFILKRLEIYAVDIVGEYQCIFKKGKSTTDHIYTLRQLMEKYYEYNKDLLMLFVDFEQANNSINREQLWTSLRNFGIPNKLVNLIQMCNEQTCCRVRFLGELSSIFECKNGLRQGDALSPVLFNLALEKVVSDTSDLKEMVIIGSYTLLAYADDIILLGESRNDVEESAKKLIKSSCNMY